MCDLCRCDESRRLLSARHRPTQTFSPLRPHKLLPLSLYSTEVFKTTINQGSVHLTHTRCVWVGGGGVVVQNTSRNLRTVHNFVTCFSHFLIQLPNPNHPLRSPPREIKKTTKNPPLGIKSVSGLAWTFYFTWEHFYRPENEPVRTVEI